MTINRGIRAFAAAGLVLVASPAQAALVTWEFRGNINFVLSGQTNNPFGIITNGGPIADTPFIYRVTFDTALERR